MIFSLWTKNTARFNSWNTIINKTIAKNVIIKFNVCINLLLALFISSHPLVATKGYVTLYRLGRKTLS